eukprot:gnl/MRDRNA2_/MRDRNA2_29129_c0_seq1.p1 gnl/MRDRNA2_/MRDRNA2_29129_c0~~gnl/MRDRNA2_/MRDRNA2_29129_c0_seq1.p1  ORF type:complete len:172 (+),score=31.53 gnl/MRDRNA2_/MRDRNA2_29129_c0_seq1:83-598(+)
MMKVIAVLFFATAVEAISIASKQPIGDGANACEGITCAIIECAPPFVTKTPDDLGSCCPVCMSDLKVPEDRSWAAGMTGGIGMNNNADPILCRSVVCPPLDCPEFDQGFDGRCCTKCKSSMETKTKIALDPKRSVQRGARGKIIRIHRFLSLFFFGSGCIDRFNFALDGCH